MTDTSDLTEQQIEQLRRDLCPDCGLMSLKIAHNAYQPSDINRIILCERCGAGFEVIKPRYVYWARRVKTERGWKQ